ncbi:MAG TPA: hypothetical protein VFF65_12985 [Phycisphaerales bacterium]|nr:hypothetical protein [Phycisphaerales bacterium]
MKTAHAAALVSAAALLVLGACRHERTTSTTSYRTEEAAAVAAPSISLNGPDRPLLVGDTATFYLKSSNTLGRDTRIRWSTTAGRLTTDVGGSVARVRFDETGVYTVKATLEVDGNPVQTEQVDVRVSAVK